jgi:N-acetylmuramoyl-L-alanine amidase
MPRAAVAVLMLGILACAPRQPASVATPVLAAAARVPLESGLPGMDSVTGPLALTIRYPDEGATIAARDSTFLFGSAGTGRATLTVNGASVKVWPNGAWLAWVPLPDDTLMRFTAVAVSGTDSSRVTRTVRRPRRFVPPPMRAAWIDSSSLAPRGRVWWPVDEWLPLALRASPGSSVSLWQGGRLLAQLVPDHRLPQVDEGVRAFDRDTLNLRRSIPADRYEGRIRARNRLPGDSAWTLQVVNGADTVRMSWPIEFQQADTTLGVVELDDDPTGSGTTDGITVARALRGGTYTWFWPTGTHARADARVGADLRLALAPGVHAWVPAAEATVLRGVAAQHPVVGSLTLSSDSASVTLRIPLSDRIPFQVIESERRLDLVLYGAVSDANWVRYGPSDDSLVSAIAWTQDDPRGVVLSVSLSLPVWGYRVRYDHGDMLLEIHRPPALDGGHPMRGLLVVVDPGHPPVGATGPTGLWEPVPNLGIALKLRDLLAEAGARVVMTRTSDSAVDLYPRTRLADSLGADLLISVHNNALPDGVNPFTNNGTSVFYNHPRSIPLARAVDAELVKALGVRDLGYARGDLALVRPTWMPAILTEGLFIMLPEQEAALRSDKGQALYARGVFRGIEAFLKARRALTAGR